MEEEKPADDKYRWTLIRTLLWEKLPLFALAALSCIVTFAVQAKAGAVASLERIPTAVRIANSLVSYIIYIGKMVWPANLAVFYPYPGLRPSWQVLGAALLFIAVTFTVIREAKRFPYLAVGWLWFAGTLVPVLGIVQVGSQAMADRYTYIPLIGLFIMASWGIPELLKEWRYRNRALSSSSALVFACFFIATWTQAGYWRNSIKLYDHALKVTNLNDAIHNNRGDAFSRLGNLKEAISDFDEAVEINPENADAYYNRGVTYGKLGDFGQAISDYDRSIEINPKRLEPYYNRGFAYGKLGDNRKALSDYNRAIEIDPEYAPAYYNRGVTYGKLGNPGQAISDFDRAIAIDPHYARAYYNLGIIYGKLGSLPQAISDFDRAIKIDPDYARAYNNRGVAYGELGNLRNAISDYDKAIETNPEYADAYQNRGIAYDKLGNREQATEDLQKAAKLGNEDAKKMLKRQGINW